MIATDFKKDIEATAKVARKNGQQVKIYRGLPMIAIDSSKTENDEYFFQGEEASNLLEEAEKASNKFDVSEEDYILFAAQGW